MGTSIRALSELFRRYARTLRRVPAALEPVADLDGCDRQFADIEATGDIHEACARFALLFDSYHQIAFEMEQGTVYWRGRKSSSEPWEAPAELGCPPANLVKLGRLNGPNDPCFYAANDRNTALAEIHAREGEFVHLAGFRVRPSKSIRVAVIGELFHLHKTGYLRLTGNDVDGAIAGLLNKLPYEDARRTLYIDAFFAQVLADARAGSRGYLQSRALAATVLRDQAIDGIHFPSVRDRLGMNIALKSAAVDDQLRMVCCMLVKVTKRRRNGFVDFEIVHEAYEMTAAGALRWRKPSSQTHSTFFNATKAEYEAAMKAQGLRPKT